MFLCENGGVIYKDEQCMDYNNLRNMARFVGGDPEHKVPLLMDHTRRPGDVPTHGIPGTLKLPGRMCWKAARLCWKNCADRRIL